MSREKEWARGVALRLQSDLVSHAASERELRVVAGARLAYAHEVRTYDAAGRPDLHVRPYETDLLVSEHRPGGSWTPRVVIEGKLGSVTTHDALTYSAKAAAHKAIHPHLRYGILVGKYGARVPGRLMRHGAHFDFMAVWCAEEPAVGEWSLLLSVVIDEIRASRLLEEEVLPSRGSGRACQLLHRPLRLLTADAQPGRAET